jgi:hypothetical protein
MNDPEQHEDGGQVPPAHPADPDHTGPDVVPIPVALAHLPVVAGMVVPWVTASAADGRPVFGQIDATRHDSCLMRRLCQVCGDALGDRTVLLVRDRDLRNQFTAEPGLHPWCAAYTMRACPMVAGRMDHYRRTPRSTTAGPLPRPPHAEDDVLSALVDLAVLLERANSISQSAARRGAPAEPWSAIWVPRYDVIRDPATRTLSASFAHTPVLTVRRVANPLTVDDACPAEDDAGDQAP